MNVKASQNPIKRTGLKSSAGGHFDHYRHSKIIKRASSYKPFSMRSLQPLVVTILLLCFSHAIANDSLSGPTGQDKQHEDTSEIGIGVGILIFLGPDFRIFYRQSDSPWVFGLRYLDINDDFMNESAVGLPADESDKEYTKRFGIYFDYLLKHLSALLNLTVIPRQVPISAEGTEEVSGIISDTILVCSYRHLSDLKKQLPFAAANLTLILISMWT